jgi:hypothetical protein
MNTTPLTTRETFGSESKAGLGRHIGMGRFTYKAGATTVRRGGRLTLWLSGDAGDNWYSVSISDNLILETIWRVKISENGETIVFLAPSDLGPYNIFVSIDGGNSFKAIKQEKYGINTGYIDISTSGNYIYIYI